MSRLRTRRSRTHRPRTALVAALAGVIAGVVGSAPVLPAALRAVLVLAALLTAPGAACVYLLGLRDVVSGLTVTIGVSVAVLLLLSMSSLLIGDLAPRAVLAVDLLLAIALLGVAWRRTAP